MNTTYIAGGAGVLILLVILGGRKSGGGAQVFGADPAVVNASVAAYNAQLGATTHLNDNKTSVTLAGIKAQADSYAVQQSTSLGRYTLDVANQMNTTNAGRDVTLGGYALQASNHSADAQASAVKDATAGHLAEVQSTNAQKSGDSFLGFLGGLVGPILGIFGL